MRRANIVDRDPQVEAIEAARRNLHPDEGVQEVLWLQKHRSLRRNHVATSPVDLNQILMILTKKRIPFVLTGTHGIAAWMGRSRNTHDVDVLVKAGRNHNRAVKAIADLYPQLVVQTFTGLTAFFVPGDMRSVIDVACPHRADLEETLANAIWTQNEAGIRYRIPNREEALANKYGAMIASNRELPKRMQDAVDFLWIVTHSKDAGQQPIDLVRLEVLGEKVWPGGGGEELKRLVGQVLAGSAIDINSLG